MDLPFGAEAKLALHYAAEESEQLKHDSVGSGRLLVDLEEARKQVALLAANLPAAPTPPPDPTASAAAPIATEFSREDLRRLVDQLPQSKWDIVGQLLELLTDKE